MRAFQKHVSHLGLFNSLSQTLMKLTSPGVPDIYQGTEIWDFSLVDPDNRRPVDYEHRRQLLAGPTDEAPCRPGGDLRGLARELDDAKEDGRIKLYVTYQGPSLPPRPSRAVCHGGVHPPGRRGVRRPRTCSPSPAAHGEAAAVVAVPRLVARLAPDPGRSPLGAEVWQDTRLPLTGLDPALRWRNVFTGEVLTPEDRDGQPSLAAADLFAHFPVALLLAEPGG